MTSSLIQQLLWHLENGSCCHLAFEPLLSQYAIRFIDNNEEDTIKSPVIWETLLLFGESIKANIILVWNWINECLRKHCWSHRGNAENHKAEASLRFPLLELMFVQTSIICNLGMILLIVNKLLFEQWLLDLTFFSCTWWERWKDLRKRNSVNLMGVFIVSRPTHLPQSVGTGSSQKQDLQ